MTIADFILARISEREAKARAARTPIEVLADVGLIYGYESRGHWYVAFEADSKVDDVVETLATAMTDPGTLLARCAIDRQIVAEHRPEYEQPLFDDYECHTCLNPDNRGGYPDLWTAQPWPCITLRLLASLNADHPDYDESWKP